MLRTSHRIARYAYVVAVLTAATVVMLADLAPPAHALGGQVQSRNIKLSDSSPSGTSVRYTVSFIPTATTSVGGIVVDFCADSPIIGSTTCTFPTGFTLGTSVSVSNLAGIGTGGSWVTTNSLQCGAAASNFQVLLLTNTTAQAPTGSPTPISFDITGVTNTSTTGSFYARIYTFDASAHTTTNYTCSSATVRPSSATLQAGGLLDYGGDALSTVTQVSISATVQETLTFCVSGSTITGTCGGLTAPTLTIGSGTPAVLSTSNVSGTPAYTQLSTNANGGSVIRMKAVNACTNGGLTVAPPDVAGGCLAIPGIGSSATVFTAGTADFGMCVAPGAGITAATNYNDTVNNCPTTGNNTSKYGMNGGNLTSTYGDQIYSAALPVTNISSSLTFVAEAANTTAAGVYQGNEILIATGTF